MIRTLKVEIVKPLDRTWGELEILLRTQRRLIPQLLRAGMDARIAAGVVSPETVKSALCPDARGGSPQAITYQAILRELKRAQTSKTWSEAARPALQIGGDMVSSLQQRVTQLYAKRASFNGHQPIPSRKTVTSITATEAGIQLSVKLLSQGSVLLAIAPSTGSHWATLRRIADGKVPHGDCKIAYDERRGKWYGLLSYEQEAKVAPDAAPSNAVIVHRGIRNALTLMSTTGAYRREPGAKLLAQLQQLEARMSNTRRISKSELGNGARGHGKRRRYEHYDALSNKRARVVHTWCQQMAATLAAFAQAQSCQTILIEDYGGIDPAEERSVRRVLTRFPLFQLKQAIANRCERDGLELAEYPAAHISATCPRCGERDSRSHNQTTGTFHCVACSFARPVDFVAALNALRLSDADSSVWDSRLRATEDVTRQLSQEAP